jgi:S1-C subfamily serine protease
VVHSSGVVVDAGAGLILTTAHTLWGARSLKLSTNVGVLHGRLVARDPCDDLAIVQTQPRLPGLVAMKLSSDDPSGLVTAVGRRWERSSARQSRTLVTIPARVEEPGRGGAALPSLRLTSAAPLSGVLVPDASGGPLLDARGRFVGLAAVDPNGKAVTIPGRLIAERFDQLNRGRTTVYVGWREHYRCAGRLHALAAGHAGYRPVDARLNAPVPATRLVPTEKEASK